ncbi:unnamed protein product [Closterium sp. NIES-54]
MQTVGLHQQSCPPLRARHQTRRVTIATGPRLLVIVDPTHPVGMLPRHPVGPLPCRPVDPSTTHQLRLSLLPSLAAASTMGEGGGRESAAAALPLPNHGWCCGGEVAGLAAKAKGVLKPH